MYVGSHSVVVIKLQASLLLTNTTQERHQAPQRGQRQRALGEELVGQEEPAPRDCLSSSSWERMDAVGLMLGTPLDTELLANTRCNLAMSTLHRNTHVMRHRIPRDLIASAEDAPCSA